MVFANFDNSLIGDKSASKLMQRCNCSRHGCTERIVMNSTCLHVFVLPAPDHEVVESAPKRSCKGKPGHVLCTSFDEAILNVLSRLPLNVDGRVSYTMPHGTGAPKGLEVLSFLSQNCETAHLCWWESPTRLRCLPSTPMHQTAREQCTECVASTWSLGSSGKKRCD